jgi:hypothetical protein
MWELIYGGKLRNWLVRSQDAGEGVKGGSSEPESSRWKRKKWKAYGTCLKNFVSLNLIISMMFFLYLKI